MKSPFLGPRRANLFFFDFAHSEVETLCKAFNHHNNLNCINLHRILSTEERRAAASEHFSPFRVCIPHSTARAELVRKKNKIRKIKKRPHVERLFQCDSLHFRFMFLSLSVELYTVTSAVHGRERGSFRPIRE